MNLTANGDWKEVQDGGGYVMAGLCNQHPGAVQSMTSTVTRSSQGSKKHENISQDPQKETRDGWASVFAQDID